jgi:hypothetical protein
MANGNHFYTPGQTVSARDQQARGHWIIIDTVLILILYDSHARAVYRLEISRELGLAAGLIIFIINASNISSVDLPQILPLVSIHGPREIGESFEHARAHSAQWSVQHPAYLPVGNGVSPVLHPGAPWSITTCTSLPARRQ